MPPSYGFERTFDSLEFHRTLSQEGLAHIPSMEIRSLINRRGTTIRINGDSLFVENLVAEPEDIEEATLEGLGLHYPDINAPTPTVVKQRIFTNSRPIKGLSKPKEIWQRALTTEFAFMQNYLAGGREYVVDAFAPRPGEYLDCVVQRKLSMTDHGNSLSVRTLRHPEIEAQTARAVKALSLQGVINFEYKEMADGSVHPLEANSRFGMNHYAVMRAGVNLPLLVVKSALGLPLSGYEFRDLGERAFYCVKKNNAELSRVLG